eukprot:gene16447-18769_t
MKRKIHLFHVSFNFLCNQKDTYRDEVSGHKYSFQGENVSLIKLPRLSKLWLAPFQLHRNLVAKIDALGDAAGGGESTRIVAKMNSLTDEALIRSLMRAGALGVQIDLIVRGACMLPAQVPGITEIIRVRSVIGRFLEHSRVFYFRQGEVQDLYLSCADWMNRNMVRRVELAWPVTDPALRQRHQPLEDCTHLICSQLGTRTCK